MTPTSSSPNLAAKRDRLVQEVREAEAKLARLRAALEVRRKNLSRLDAQLAIAGGDARGLRTDA